MNKFKVVKGLLSLKKKVDIFFKDLVKSLGYRYVCSHWQGMDSKTTYYWEVYVLKEFYPLVNHFAEDYKEVLYVSDLERLLNKPIPPEAVIRVSGNVEFDSSYIRSNVNDLSC